MFYFRQRLAYWANSYFKPYPHAGPYCIGIIAGYILATHPKLKFSKVGLIRIFLLNYIMFADYVLLFCFHF